MRHALLLVSMLGLCLFGGSFAVSFLDPLLVERAAREVVRIEVERRVGQKVDDLSNSRIAALAGRVLQNTEVDIEEVQRVIRADLPRKVANVVANMLDADCECRKRLVEYAQRAESERLASLTQVREKLVGLIESTYASVASHLLREFRIFTASNAIAFAVLGVVTVIRRKATLQLMLPALVLVGAVIVTGGLYVFNQNWVHTVIYSQYVGLAYALYLAGVALLLADVFFNRARVTTRMVNALYQLVGATATALPC